MRWGGPIEGGLRWGAVAWLAAAGAVVGGGPGAACWAAAAGIALSRLVAPARSAGPSMWPTLGTGSLGVVLRPPLVALRRGDLVFAETPAGGAVLKRLVALPGDRVATVDGALRVNGAPAVGSRLPVDLSLGHLRDGPERRCDGMFLLGDHVSSEDSRHLGPWDPTLVRGRYVPILQWGRPSPTPLGPAERAALGALNEAGRGALAVAAVLAGAERTHVGLLLQDGLAALGRDDLAESLLRTLRTADARNGVYWSARLGVLLSLRARFDAVLEALPEDLAAEGEHHALVNLLRSRAASRLGRWEEALASAVKTDPDGVVFVPSRLVALSGLGRVAEARALAARWDADGTWPDPGQRAWYLAYLATAEGAFDVAAAHLSEAVDAGFPDAAAARDHPLLAPLRAHPAWARVQDRLLGPVVA